MYTTENKDRKCSKTKKNLIKLKLYRYKKEMRN